ncbi:MAG TPA: hypothetical protein VN673_16575 [Clostridia bacterium]|nr:hypothetical protein [Clostridia bacterium]
MSDLHLEGYQSFIRRCWVVFAVVVAGTLLMVGASYAPLENKSITIGLVLSAACVNAFIVAGYLMHLLSERRTIHTVLVFTAVFFIGLMGLTVWASFDLPAILKQ